MKTFYLTLLTSFLFVAPLRAQSDTISDQATETWVRSVELLQDKGYSFERVLKDSTLRFSKNLELRDFKSTDFYWIRFKAYHMAADPHRFYLFAFPNLKNTLYYFDRKNQRWRSRSAGLAVADSLRNPGLIPYVFPGNAAETFYLKMRVSDLKQSDGILHATVIFHEADAADAQEQKMLRLWTATMAVIAILFLYNTYIYFLFKDKAYLYYLLILAGAMLYITTYGNFTNVFWNARHFTVLAAAPGLYNFSLNLVLMQLSIIMIITGLVHYSRTYLETKSLLPRWDGIIVKCNVVLTAILSLSTILTASGLYYSYRYTNYVTNLLIVVMLFILFYIGFLSLRKGLQQARYFLIANSLPMLIVLGITVFFMVNITNRGPEFLPNLAVTLQAITLAVALVARVNVIKDNLKAKEIEAERLRLDNEQIALKNQMIALENQYVNAQIAIAEAEKEKLQEALDHNQRELVSATMYVYQKNEMLAELKKQIGGLQSDNKETLRQIKSTIQNNLYMDADWEKFKIHFEKVHPQFFEDLLAKYPTLTPNEVRLSAYFHLNLTVKEIATLLNIDPESVRKAKTRMTKKMNS